MNRKRKRRRRRRGGGETRERSIEVQSCLKLPGLFPSNHQFSGQDGSLERLQL
jgi:hypothetical protein